MAGFRSFTEDSTEYKNNTLLVKESFRGCITTTYNLRHNISTNSPQRLTTQGMFHDYCALACLLNPVQFLVCFQNLLQEKLQVHFMYLNRK